MGFHRLASIFAAMVAISSAICTDTGSIAAEEDRPPNIIFILADDVGTEALGCYGGESYKTPRLDKLAAQGMKFTHCYSMPVCHPTRVCLLSGRYPFHLGNPKWGSYPKEAELTTVANTLKSAGYATAVAGKWQLALLKNDVDQPHRLGFDDYCVFGWHEGPRYWQPMLYQNGNVRDDTREKYGPTVYVDFLADFMKKNRNKPFFAFYSMALCHDVTDDIKGHVPFAPDKDRYETFAEMVEQMDLHVGKLLDKVDELGLTDNTIVIFTTDNGSPASSYLNIVDGKMKKAQVVSRANGREIPGGKGSLKDGGTHVPMIVRWPGRVPEGKDADPLVDFSDFYVTFAELAAAKLPAEVDLDGHSFANLLKGERFKPRRIAFSQGRNGMWVRTKDYKLYADGRFVQMNVHGTEIALKGERKGAEAFAKRQLQTHLDKLLER